MTLKEAIEKFRERCENNPQYKEMIEKSGGKNSSSISKKTSFVLAGENMGPTKLEKCLSLGIQIINEDEFLNMMHFNKN